MRRLRPEKLSSLTIQLAPPPTKPESERGYDVPYPAIHWLNDDILLSIFNCYRLSDRYHTYHWYHRHLWFKLSQVCRRWRHLIYQYAFLLGIHIKCTNGSPIVDTLDHLPSLPLFVEYTDVGMKGLSPLKLTMQDELGIYHAIRLHDRVHHIELQLPSSILHKVFELLDELFPILEHISLRFSLDSKDILPLPKAFAAPNLRHLVLPTSITPPRRLQLLTSAVSLVTLRLSKIQSPSYFRPRLLVARLRSLPQLKELYIGFSVPVPRPSTESVLLGEQGVPVILPSLKNLQFKGTGAYMESFAAQIRAPLLEQLRLTLFNQIAFSLPHLSYLINITEALKLSKTTIGFGRDNVYLTTDRIKWGPFIFYVICKPLDWQIDCAYQICKALIPAFSGVEQLELYDFDNIPAELRNGAIDSATWHNLLRPFIGVKELYICHALLEELSSALQVDEVGLDPEFLPNLRCIHATDNPFAPFIEARQAVGRPVQFSQQLL